MGFEIEKENSKLHIVQKKRLEYGLSLGDLSELSGVPIETIFSIERGAAHYVGSEEDRASWSLMRVLGLDYKTYYPPPKNPPFQVRIRDWIDRWLWI